MSDKKVKHPTRHHEKSFKSSQGTAADRIGPVLRWQKRLLSLRMALPSNWERRSRTASSLLRDACRRALNLWQRRTLEIECASKGKPKKTLACRIVPAWLGRRKPLGFALLLSLTANSYGADELQWLPGPPQTQEEATPRPGVAWQYQNSASCQPAVSNGWGCDGESRIHCQDPYGNSSPAAKCHTDLKTALATVGPMYLDYFSRKQFPTSDVVVRVYDNGGIGNIDIYVYPAARNSEGNAGAGEGGSCGSVDPGAYEGNPTRVSTGNKFHREQDFVGPGKYTIAVERFYNSQVINSGPLGLGWSATYFQHLDTSSADLRIFAYRPDGRVIFFNKVGGALQPGFAIAGALKEVLNEGTRVGWDFTTEDDRIERYDLNGQLTSITFSNSHVHHLSYDQSGLLSRVDDDSGRSVSFSYDTKRRITSAILPDGQVVAYSYAADGQLSLVQYPGLSTKQYLYENPRYKNALTGIRDENGVRYATYVYDSQGRVTGSAWSVGGQDVYAFSFAYSGDGTTVVTDPMGVMRQHRFQNINGIARTTAIQGPSSPRCPFATAAYDSATGYPVQRSDWNGVVTTYQRNDPSGRLDLETQRVEASGTASARTVTSTWHPDWRKKTKVVEPYSVTTTIFNGQSDPFNSGAIATCTSAAALANGKPVPVVCRQIEQATLSDGTLDPAVATRITSYTYDASGRVLTATDPRGHTTNFVYYSSANFNGVASDAIGYSVGDLQSITNALGQVTQFTLYDKAGRLRQFVDPKGITTDIAYTPRGWVASTTTTALGGTNRSTSYTYDGVGQLVQVSEPDGTALSYRYDTAHRLTGITDARGNSISYTLDNIGNRIAEDVRDPTGTLQRSVTRYFDALARLQQVVGAVR